MPPSPGSAFSIAYFPDVNSITNPERTRGQWFSDGVRESNGTLSPRFDSLIGNGVSPSETFTEDTVITVDCADSGEVVTANFTITETGTTGGVITKVIQSDPNGFSKHARYAGERPKLGSTQSPQSLAAGQSATISVQYLVMGSVSTSAVDYITAIDQSGDTIGGTPLKLTVNVNDVTETVSALALKFWAYKL